MILFIVRRLFSSALVLWGAATIVFLLAYSIPSDPARAAVGRDATQEQVDAYRREVGLDQPLSVQYVRYLDRLSRGDLGVSITTRRPVVDELTRLMPATLEIVIPSLVLAGVLGVVLGVTSAIHAGRWQDRLSQVTALFGMSMPIFWLALMLQLVFYGWLDWLPLGGRLPPGVQPPPSVTNFYVVDALVAGDFGLAVTAAQHLVLPVAVLTAWNLPLISRLTRGVMLETLRLDFVRTARGKGLGEGATTYRHALRATMIPIMTVFGLRVGAALGGAVVAETVFGWPGVGRALVQAITSVDYPVITGMTLVLCAAYVVINLAVDLSYAILDPRIAES